MLFLPVDWSWFASLTEVLILLQRCSVVLVQTHADDVLPDPGDQDVNIVEIVFVAILTCTCHIVSCLHHRESSRRCSESRYHPADHHCHQLLEQSQSPRHRPPCCHWQTCP